jgi:hypothetical protein
MAGDDRTGELMLLRDIARWTREAALPIVRTRVERLLDSEPKKRVYEALAAGTAGVTAIERSTGVNASKDISPWIRLWMAEGIVDRASNPPKATLTLNELGIAPPLPKTDRPRKAAGT